MIIETDTRKTNKMNEKKHWTIVTVNGTHWAAEGTSEQEVRDNFFGESLGVEIEEVQPVRLFTHEEEQQLRTEKLEEMSR
mgnify:CR=1 FL=1|jgi:hypothetical protein|tara:strand:- start:960 stop:1199 length:240 start_codon:yes stop_codon:yes gene_type:complete